MARTKVQAIKLAKLDQLIKDVEPVIRAQIDEYQAQTEQERVRNSIASQAPLIDMKMMNCVLLNGLFHKRLIDNDFPTARLVAGKAVFGVSTEKYGVIDYGYQNEINAQHLGKHPGMGGNFDGHCWIEIKKLGVVVDLTLRDLKRTMIKDNQLRGINETAYSLPVNKLVIPMEEMTTRQAIVDGSTGYMYSQTGKDTEFAVHHFELLLDIARQAGVNF